MPLRHERRAPVGEYWPLRITTAGTLVPVGRQVNTTSAATINPGTQTIAVASLTNIVPQMLLLFIGGNSGVSEVVQVASVNRTTSSITATFAASHSGAYNILSLYGTFLGPVVVNNPGTTGCSLQLWNGSPQMSPAGTMIANIPLTAGVNSYPYALALDQGLFYTLTIGSGTPDITLHYLDMAN